MRSTAWNLNNTLRIAFILVNLPKNILSQQSQPRQIVKFKTLPEPSWVSSVGGELQSLHDKFHFMLGTFSEETIQSMRRTKWVDYIEEDALVQIAADSNGVGSWGLDRIDQRGLPLDQKYDFIDSGGVGVDIYIVDTGIFVEHSDFDGRAKSGVTALVGPDGDRNGHGTFVAGIIGGKRYGVAKQANLISVKALSERGYGTTSSVLRGLQYVYLEHQTKENKKTVLNLSLMSNFSRIINEAVNETALSGIVIVVPAGNGNGSANATEGVDACGYSPVSAANVISVGSTNILDQLSVSSNYGPCVTIYAPGENVTSDFIGSTSAVSTLTGTSFAAAHVSGVAALILSNYTELLLPSEVRERIISLSTRNAIQKLPANSVNRLLYKQLQNYRSAATQLNDLLVPCLVSLLFVALQLY
ncbi:hypothetical protein K7432_008417 [Basidiobolus ranarum]|uniref:Peptidase S8/S53 domain-containing protein n=1 Tax=Basidiobolus ranarum TaxID=34480 RepID=A0ABR2VYL2_9FUNG